MQLGVSLGYFTDAGQISDGIDLAVAAERLGYDCVWVAEAYGTDAPTPLAAIAARTTTIGIGSAVMQIPARSAAMTAMTAATLDGLSGGRFRLGLGVSGPQVAEGWHGSRYNDPLGRTDEYVALVRAALSRKVLRSEGPHYPLPLPDGPGKPLVLAMRPLRKELPIYLAAVGPKNLALTGRIADGWHGIFFDPELGAEQVATIRSGAADAGRDLTAFDFAVNVGAAIGPDPATAADAVRPTAALYIGGMGSRKTNFYHRIATAMGFGAEADRIQDLYLARDYAGAAAAVPLEFCTRTSLLGTVDEMAAGLRRLQDAGITSANIAAYGRTPAERISILEAVVAARAVAGLDASRPHGG